MPNPTARSALLRHHRSSLLWLIGSLSAATTIYRSWHFLYDDAYISFRYARNLIEHGELVWNLGERVEGYTNFLHVLSTSSLMLIGLPHAQHDQARAPLRAAWKLEAKEGLRKLDQYASWLQRDWPDAAASVREGLDEIFTVNRLGLPAARRTCLTTTNIIDSTHSGIRQRTRRVTNWKNGEMALR